MSSPRGTASRTPGQGRQTTQAFTNDFRSFTDEVVEEYFKEGPPSRQSSSTGHSGCAGGAEALRCAAALTERVVEMNVNNLDPMLQALEARKA